MTQLKNRDFAHDSQLVGAWVPLGRNIIALSATFRLDATNPRGWWERWIYDFTGSKRTKLRIRGTDPAPGYTQSHAL